MLIKVDDLRGLEIIALLREHLDDMAHQSPPESVHALDLNALRQPDITFWSAWRDEVLLGCAALKELDHQHAEIKSMRTSPAARRTGVGATLLQHVLDQARVRGYLRLSLETGSMAAFKPARALYRRAGFAECEPFGSYQPDPNSVFMTMQLSN